MNYQKVTFSIESTEDYITELIIYKLGEIGFESFEETETGLDAYIAENNFDKIKIIKQINSLPFKEDIFWKNKLIKDQNWNKVWEENYFKPLIIKNKCVVRAPFHKDFPKCEYEIIIEPNMAFGTGNHETTSMMIEAILEENLNGLNVLDMGCGTGILSIMASKLGADKIVAIDINEWAYKGTIENARLNKIKNIEPKMGDKSLLSVQSFDLIMANIQRNVLLADMERYISVMNKGGKLIMSGFYSEDIPFIKEKAENLGLIDMGFQQKNNWIAHSFTKQE